MRITISTFFKKVELLMIVCVSYVAVRSVSKAITNPKIVSPQHNDWLHAYDVGGVLKE